MGEMSYVYLLAFFSLAHMALIFTLHLIAARISYFLTAATKFSCCSFNKTSVSHVFYLSLPPLPLSLSLFEFHCVFSVPSHEIFPGIFSGNRRFSLPFLDLDECVQGSHDCLQSLASCSNTDGSFKCSCNDGYIGDGKTYCQPKGKDVFIFSMSGFISLQGSHHGNHQGIAKCKLQRLKWADFDNDDHGDGVDIRIISLIMKMMITTIIIRCKCFFLCIGRQPATWPANNCLQIMVCSCAMSFNCKFLA